MSYAGLLKILWRRRVVAFVLAASVVVSAYGFLAGQPKKYRSTATVGLFPSGSDVSVAAYYSSVLERLIPAYAELIRSRSFLDGVSKRLPAGNGRGLAASVVVEPIGGAGVIRIHAKANEPLRAAEVATATARAFKEAVANIGVVEVRILDEAPVNQKPVAPNVKLALAASVLLGLFVGGVGAVAWERFFGRIRDVGGLAEASGVPVLGAIPREPSLQGNPRIVAGDLALAEFENSLRALGTNLVFEAQRAGAKSIAVLSLDPEAGRSLLAANLGVVIGELGSEVLVIDADTRHPTQHKLFGLSNDQGLSSIVLDGTAVTHVVAATPYPGVQVVVAGPPVTTRMQEANLYKNVVPYFSDYAELVLVDAPPLLTAADIRLLASSVSGVVLVVRAGSLAPGELQATISTLRQLETKLLGAVLTFSRIGFLHRRPFSTSSDTKQAAIRV